MIIGTPYDGPLLIIVKRRIECEKREVIVTRGIIPKGYCMDISLGANETMIVERIEQQPDIVDVYEGEDGA